MRIESLLVAMLAASCWCVLVDRIDGAAAPTSSGGVGSYPRVVHYVDQRVNRPPTPLPSDHWSTYDESVVQNGIRSAVSDYDDARVFQPIGYCMPFFGIESAEIHISSNGFLSPMAAAPVEKGWGQGITSFWNGPNGESSGGFWPAIGLFVTDLQPESPTTPDPGGIYAYRTNKTYGDGITMDVAIVEYYDVRPFPQNIDGPPTGKLRAQVELWPNGTIVMRYKEVIYFPSQTTRPGEKEGPSVGLVWSSRQRVVADTPYHAAPESSGQPPVSIIAVRFDAVTDECYANHTTCESCADRQGCVWCASTRQCVSELIQLDFCEDSDARTSASVCGGKLYASSPSASPAPSATSAADNTAAPAEDRAQVFYTSELSPLAVDETFDDIRRDGFAKKIVEPGTGNIVPSSANLSLPFPFPFFYNPRTKDPNHPRMLTNLYVLGSGQIISSSPDQSCETHSSFFYCDSLNYEQAIVPFAILHPDVSRVEMHTLELPAGRKNGDRFCSRDTCPSGFVIQVVNVGILGRFQRFAYQVYIDGEGHIEIHYGGSGITDAAAQLNNADLEIYETLSPSLYATNASESLCDANISIATPMFTMTGVELTANIREKPPLIGVFRNGLDGSQLRIPSQVIAAGKHVVARIAPVPGCDDCNGRGKCDYVNRVCICDGNFTGPTCEQCVNGTFGPSCAGCPDCLNGGRCLDGVDGGGTCACVSPYSGQNCELMCENAATMTAAELQCPGCNLLGGYCECGRCVCFRERGWSGSECEKWDDPCRRFSLDGCEVCLKYEPVQCQYCREHSCIAVSDSAGIDGNYTNMCRESALVDSTFCTSYKHPFTEDGSLTVIAIVVLFTAMAICTCVTVTVVCICRKRSPNPMVQNTVIGTPDYDIPRREREIIQLHTLQRPKKGVAVQGIPLKVIPLKDLQKLQRSAQGDTPQSPATPAVPRPGSSLVSHESVQVNV